MAFKALLEIKGQQFDILSYQNQFFYPNPRDMMFYMKDDIFEEIEDPVRLFGSMHKYHCWQNRLLEGYDRPSRNSPAYRATANLLGGLFTFTIESTGRENVFEHAVSSHKDYQTPLLNGQIKFMGREEEDLPIQKIEFWDGFVCEMSEHFSATGNIPMTMEITISAASIRVNDSVVIQKDWRITNLQNEMASQRAYSRAATSNIAPVGTASGVVKSASKGLGKSLGKVLEKKAGGLIEKLGETVVNKLQEEGVVEKFFNGAMKGIVKDEGFSDEVNFFPIVYVTMSSDNSEDIIQNYIMKVFQKSDIEKVKLKPFITKMNYSQLSSTEEYLVPYLRIWPSQTKDRIFKLSCITKEGLGNDTDEGEVFCELPFPIDGLSVLTTNGSTSDNIYIGEHFSVELHLKKHVDRTKREITNTPLVFYVINNGIKTEVGRIHLSIAPKDVFSEGEIKDVENYLKNKPFQTHKVRNEKGELIGHDCITAIRVSAEKLLQISLIKAIKPQSFNIWDFKEYIENNEYLKQSIPINIGDENDVLIIPPPSDQRSSRYLKENIENSLGYHYIAIGAAEIHTLVLLVNYVDLLKPTFSIFDQHGYSGRSKNLKLVKDIEYKNIDTQVWQEIATWREYAKVSLNKRFPAKAILLKLQHALLVLVSFFTFVSCNVKMSGSSLSVNNSRNLHQKAQEEVTKTTFDASNSFLFNDFCDLIFDENLVLSKMSNIDTIDTYFFENFELSHKKKFISGTIASFDEHRTEKPMLSLYEFKFDTILSATAYMHYIADSVFQIYNFSEEKYVSLLNSNCARIYRIKETIYLIECCFGSHLENSFQRIVSKTELIGWDEIYRQSQLIQK